MLRQVTRAWGTWHDPTENTSFQKYCCQLQHWRVPAALCWPQAGAICVCKRWRVVLEKDSTLFHLANSLAVPVHRWFTHGYKVKNIRALSGSPCSVNHAKIKQKLDLNQWKRRKCTITYRTPDPPSLPCAQMLWISWKCVWEGEREEWCCESCCLHAKGRIRNQVPALTLPV